MFDGCGKGGDGRRKSEPVVETKLSLQAHFRTPTARNGWQHDMMTLDERRSTRSLNPKGKKLTFPSKVDIV